MVEPSSHCPHLGLKQNRAIRFASPTPEHRCFVTGEAQEIPVDQSSYCLCKDHINCPLYMGLSLSSTTVSAGLTPVAAGQGGLRGWLTVLSLRDRIIYGVLMTLMLAILSIYMVLAVQLLVNIGTSNDGPTMPPLPPTNPTATLNSSANEPTATALQTPTATRTARPTPTSTATPQPTPPPVSQQFITLYFADASGNFLVAVNRQASVTADQVAAAAVRELLDGPAPGSGLQSAFAAGIQLVEEVRVVNKIAVVNFDQPPGSDLAFYALSLSLTELPSVDRVQVQVNGQDIGLNGDTQAIGRRPFNIDNPLGLATSFDSRETSFLSLYFTLEGRYVRLTRLVPRTWSPARATIEELLKGAGQYAGLLEEPIPPGTQLINISFAADDDQMLVLNLTWPFVDTADRQAALDTILLSLTDLRNAQNEPIERVQILIDGSRLADYWGPDYDRPFFSRPVLNQE